MFSYFVFLYDSDGCLTRLNVASGLRPQDVPTWMEEFWKAVSKRLKELKNPLQIKDVYRFRILLDPSRDDPITVNPEQAVAMCERGAWRLSGEYPGRANYPLTI
jgi:hypothetical protein